MQDKIVCTIKPFLSLFQVKNSLIIGSGTGGYLPLCSFFNLEDVLLVEADKSQIEKMYKMHNLSNRYQVENSLIATDREAIPFYISSYNKLSGTQKLQKYKMMMPNLSLVETKELKAESLDSFTQRMNTTIDFLIIDTYTASDILKEGSRALKSVQILMCSTVLDEKNILIEEVEKKGFKKVEVFNDNNPTFVTVLFVRDYLKEFNAQMLLSNSLKEELTKETEQIKKLIARRDFLFNDVKRLKDELEKSKNELTTKESLLVESHSIIESFFESNSTPIPKAYLDRLEYEQKIDLITSFCIKQNDILLAIDNFVLSNEFNEAEKFDLCCSFSLKVAKFGDKHQAISFMNNAHYFLSNDETNKLQYKKLINLAISLDAVTLALDFKMEFNEKYGLFSDEINKKFREEYKSIRAVSQKKQAHGHDLLIDYIEKNIKDSRGEGKILVEIGTTRENIPGQGSTMQLAKLCKRKCIKFITVDMDAHNTRWANFLGKLLGLNIEAITKKGEDYLRDDIDAFDFVFLDAYDFDHGGHSELRQSRYEENLGSKIDEEACHIMHLDCAKSVVKKLKKDGVVCVDDTWKDENGEWTAKGTLAVPYFLENNLKVVQSNKNALLLKII